MGEDALDHGRVGYEGDEDASAAAVGACLVVLFEKAFDELGPAEFCGHRGGRFGLVGGRLDRRLVAGLLVM